VPQPRNISGILKSVVESVFSIGSDGDCMISSPSTLGPSLNPCRKLVGDTELQTKRVGCRTQKIYGPLRFPPFGPVADSGINMSPLGYRLAPISSSINGRIAASRRMVIDQVL